MMHRELDAFERQLLTGHAPGAAFDRPEMLCRTGDGHAKGTRMWGEIDCPACKAARYQVTDGTSYGFATPAAVVSALESARRSGERVRLFYGDPATGKAWAEENDVAGTIGRSMGPTRAPLIIANARSHGGPCVLDSSIVAIRTASGWRYRHPSFDVGTWETGPSDLPDYAEIALHNGTVHARFKRPGAAARYVAFMRGERLAK